MIGMTQKRDMGIPITFLSENIRFPDRQQVSRHTSDKGDPTSQL
jgi:hypothetical protein